MLHFAKSITAANPERNYGTLLVHFEEDGAMIEISFLTKRKTDLCTMYVAKHNIIYLFEQKHAEYASRYQKMIKDLRYPSPEMERHLSGYVPKLVTECRLADGGKASTLHQNLLLPEPFRLFLPESPKRDAPADFAKWDQVLEDSYGERKFIPLPITEEEIYSRSGTLFPKNE